MIERQLSSAILRSAAHYPVLCVTGPRQSGKTTLLRSLWPAKPYFSLEDPDVLAFATSDPRGFLDQGVPNGLLLDEAQRLPVLFNYLQGYADRSAPGTFVVSGSNNFLLIQAVTQSLAGRAGVFQLLPFSLSELGSVPEADWETAAFTGFYPRVRAAGLPADLFARDYLTTYVERDVRLVRNIQDLAEFRRFLKLCAGRAGQLLNLASLAQDAGLAVNTVKEWLNLLEASFLIFVLRPENESFNKRLVKAPKLYWHDTSLLCHLLDIRQPSDLQFHSQRGAVFENLFVAERFKSFSHRGDHPPLGFWRDNSGTEIDLVEGTGDHRVFWEAKAGKTVGTDFFKNLDRVGDLASLPPSRRRLVFGGTGRQVRSNAVVLGWKEACTASLSPGE